MDNPADPAPSVPSNSTPWWKQGMSMKQMGGYLALSLTFVLLGAGVSFYIGNSTKSKVLSAPAMAAQTETELTLDLTNPAENGVTAEKTLNVVGVTQPNTAVVVFTRDSQASGQSNDAGLFEVEIDLGEGINDLMVIAVAPSGQDKTVARQITYSPAGNTQPSL